MDYAWITKMPKGVHTRWASPENPLGLKGEGGKANCGRKGNPCFPLFPGESFILAEVVNRPGMVRRIWVTMFDRRPVMLRSLRMDFYWDSMERPSFSVPAGDFFGCGLGRAVPFTGAFLSSPEGRSFNSFFPMPFRTGMKIILTNEGTEPQPLIYYDIDYTVGDEHDENTLYFHAFFNRENPTTLQKDFTFLPRIEGTGRFLGVAAGARVNTDRYLGIWWGEGEVKMYIDGDTENPTLCGTGTEDYIGTGFELGSYSTPYQGCSLADFEQNEYAFYRFHIPDPVYFYEDLRVTIQQIGFCDFKHWIELKKSDRDLYRATGPGLHPVGSEETPGVPPYLERSDDFSSCSYFLLDRPESDLPALCGVEDRTANLYEDDYPQTPEGMADQQSLEAFYIQLHSQQTRYLK